MSLHFDNIIADADTLPLPKPIIPQTSHLLKSQKRRLKNKEKLLFCYPLNREKLFEYSKTRVPHNQRIFKDDDDEIIPKILKLKDSDPEIYYNYYYHRDLNLVGNYKLNDSLIIENRLMAIEILKVLQNLETMKLFTYGKGKFKFDEPLVCYLSGLLNQTCFETLESLETRTPASLLQYVPIDIDSTNEEEAQKIARTWDIEETKRLAMLLITEAVRYDDCWKSLCWTILCITPESGNIFRNTKIKYLKNEEEPNVEFLGGKEQEEEEDEDVKFNRIMNELHQDMINLNIKTRENNNQLRVNSSDGVSTTTTGTKFDEIMNELNQDMAKLNVKMRPDNQSKVNSSQGVSKTTTTTKTWSSSGGGGGSSTTSFEFFRPQQFEMFKLQHPLFMPISEEFLQDSSDDELCNCEEEEDYISDTDSISELESEQEQEPSNSYSNSQNQFELLTSENNNKNNIDQDQDDLIPSASSELEMGMTEQEYSEFVYDELDEDPNFIYIIEQLTDLFPTYAKTDLKFRLKFADKLEELIEELFIETESQDLIEKEEQLAKNQQQNQQTEPIYDDKVYQLREMFPNIDNATIDRKLRENNDSLPDTATSLLSLPTTEFLSVGSQHKFTTNEWNEINGLVNKIIKFLGINEDSFVIDNSDIVYFVRKSGCNYYDALVGIIMNFRPLVLQTIRKQQVGGRVQRGGGGKRNGRSTKTITKLVKSNYRYNPISKEAKELWDLVPSNEQMKSMNKTLLINALEFFQGNVYKVIELVSELSSNQTPQHTIKTISQNLQQPIIKFIPKVENDPYILIKKKFSNYADKRSLSSSTSSSSSSLLLKNKSNKSNLTNSSEKNQFNQYISSGSVDLHGFRLTEAMKLTKLILQHWWEEEEKNRELVGHMDKFGDKASIGPVRIITGRGIHSTNGISILKRYVKEYLINNKYVFDEEIGSFEVTGKRRR